MRLMDLDYAPHLSKEAIEGLEEAARAIGLPLREVELIGQDPGTVRAFVESVQRGRHDGFLNGVDWSRLERRLGSPQGATGPTGTSPGQPAAEA